MFSILERFEGVETFEKKWKWPETAGTTRKQERAGWGNKCATVLVRHGTLWPESSTSASLMCIMY